MLQYTILDAVKKPFVIYKDTITNTCTLDPRCGQNDKKAFIIAMPEGCSNITKSLMCSFNMFHLRVNYDINVINDYRFLSDEDQIKFSRKYDTYSFNLNDTLKWISLGQCVICSAKYSDDMYNLLRELGFLVYLIQKNLRSCVISHALNKRTLQLMGYGNNVIIDKHIMELYIKTPYYREILETNKMMMPWYENKLFKIIKYEDIIGSTTLINQHDVVIQLMEDFGMRREMYYEVISKIEENNNVPNWVEYWNDDIERWFAQSGLYELNKRLGYEPI